MPNYFKVFGCGRKLLNRLDVSYEQACMAPQRYDYYTKMLETIVVFNDRNNAPLSNDNIQQAVSRFMAETEEDIETYSAIGGSVDVKNVVTN